MTDRPFLLIIAGPNGSGKTTLTNRLRTTGYDLGTYINADEIAARLQQGKGAAPPEASRQAQIEADGWRRMMLEKRQSYSFETVMSHPSKIAEMEEARSLGYDVVLFFIGVDDPQINLGRVAQRVARGGHDVPADKIVARYRRTMELLPAAACAAHRTMVYDNSELSKEPELIAVIASTLGSVTVDLPIRIAQTRRWFVEFGVEGLRRHLRTEPVLGLGEFGERLEFTRSASP